MAKSMLQADKIAEALRRLAQGTVQAPDAFMTYAEFAHLFGFSASFPLAWANRTTLDDVAAILKSDPTVDVDLTFLIRNAKSGYPSVIDGRRYDQTTAHKQRAREVADQIILKFGLKAKNPY